MLSQFSETISHRWVTSAKADIHTVDNNIDIDHTPTVSVTETPRRGIRTRDVTSGHWVLTLRRKRQHFRFSTVLYTDLPERYEPVTLGVSTPQTSYFELPVDKRRQLYRAFYELSLYVPSVSDIQTYFIKDDAVIAMLEDINCDPELFGKFIWTCSMQA